MKEGLIEFVIAMRNAYEQLPDKTFQNEIGKRLDMKKSVLSKWLSISTSDFIVDNLRNLPTSFSSLYTLTLIEKKYKQLFGKLNELDTLVESKQIHTWTERSDLELILKRITQQIRIEEQQKRQDAIMSLDEGNLSSRISSKTIDEYLSDKERFRSFVVCPDEMQMQRWSDVGLFQIDIAEEFPLHDLRTPSVAETVSCFVRVKMNRIDTGIKLLNAWGFSYRDIIVPPSTNSYCSILDEEYVLLRGERGQAKNLTHTTCFSLESEDILDFVEQNYSSPYLMVFDKTVRKEWSCLTQ